MTAERNSESAEATFLMGKSLAVTGLPCNKQSKNTGGVRDHNVRNDVEDGAAT